MSSKDFTWFDLHWLDVHASRYFYENPYKDYSKKIFQKKVTGPSSRSLWIQDQDMKGED